MLDPEIREKLKADNKDRNLKVTSVGGIDVVFKVPTMSEVSSIRAKQFDLYVRPQAENFKDKLEKNKELDPTLIMENAVEVDPAKDLEMAKFIYDTVIVYPKFDQLDEPILFTFCEWFLENYIYINVGPVEDL
ncbi:MAG: hypothetical protein ACTSWR_11500 [Candidatus Helarchaeota archaeon]